MQGVSLAKLYEQFHASESGLTSEEARRRLAQYGPNDPAAAKRAGPLRQLLGLFASPLVIILLIASLASALLGDPVDALIIVVIVLVSIGLDFFQTHRSQQAADKLRAQVALTATAVRDGQEVQVLGREVVPGDILRLSAGVLVPADARLIQSRDLHANQAALTGESMPVDKDARETDASPRNPADAINMVFLGSSIESGTATALVVATGKTTAFGDIAAMLAMHAPETEFERGTRHFSMFITQVVFLLVAFVFLVSAGLKHDPLQSLLFAVALAVGLTPEFLPMIVTITLAQGAVHMSRQKVIVKNLAAIQNLGSMDVLCSDKTGTLTSGNMTLDQHVDPTGRASPRPLALSYLNSFFETGIKNPLDQAVVQKAKEESLDSKAYQKLDEIPFDFERRRLSIVVASGEKQLMVTKGSPEGVLAVCSSVEVDGQVHPMDAPAKAQCQETHQSLAKQGYRCLAVAYREVPKQSAYNVPDEKDLTLAGFLAFMDPPLEDAAATLKEMTSDGVHVKILTGDGDLVAAHVCKQIGFDPGRIVLGDDLDRVGDDALPAIVEQGIVFARVSPAQKGRIIMALKRRGHVVGYIGDGINDAPSLHMADVGISVSTAVDVAKGAADIILMERGLGVLHNGIIEGRKAFGNVIKYLLMGTSSNFGNMFSMAGASLILPFLPMLPTQILLNNFLYDLAQITIPSDNVDASYIHKPRRWNIGVLRNFMVFIGPISSLFDFLTFYVMLNVFHASEELFHTGWFVESLATQTLVLFVIRTVGNPLRSRPSRPLTVTTLLVVLIGLVLPFTPVAALLGFAPLPAGYFLFLIVAVATYLGLVELVKGRLMRRLLEE